MKTKALVIGRRLLAAVLNCALCAALMGPTARGAVFSDQAALAQAAVFAQDSIFNSVGIIGLYDAGAWSPAGSGVLIGDGSWVLCAGHELNYRPFSNAQFSLLDSAGGVSTVVNASTWQIYPGFTGSGTGQGVDLALVHLSEPITSVIPGVVYSGSQGSLSGVTACMAGFGRPGTAGNGVSAHDLIKRAGENIIGDASYPYWLESQYLISRFDAPSSASAVALEWQGSPGDSGGPWMVQDSGIWQVAGIISGGTLDPSYNFGNITYAMGVSSYLDWIYGVIGVKPSLSIQDGGTNGVRVQWPSWATSYVLQSCTDLAGSNWVAATGGITDDGTNRSATFSISTNGQEFWHLARQAALVARSEAVSAAPVWQGETGTNLLSRGFHEDP